MPIHKKNQQKTKKNNNNKTFNIKHNFKMSVKDFRFMLHCVEMIENFYCPFSATSLLLSTEISDLDNLCPLQMLASPLLKAEDSSKYIIVLHVSFSFNGMYVSCTLFLCGNMPTI